MIPVHDVEVSARPWHPPAPICIWICTFLSLQAAMETAHSVKGSDWFASMDATHGRLTAEEMTPQATQVHSLGLSAFKASSFA